MIEIHPPDLDATVLYGIASLAIIVAIAFTVLAARRGSSSLRLKLSAVVAGVMVFSAVLAATGVLTRTDIMPPPMFVMIASVFVMAFVAGFSKFGTSMVSNVQLGALIGLQMFRLPLELVMHHASKVGVMPVALSYSGYNLDIITGIGAVIISALIAAKINVPRALLWVWNLIGICCLLAIAVIAVLASPRVHAFGTEPQNLNTWVLFFPYVWLPVVLVTIAMISHIVITRKLCIKVG